MAPAQMNIIQGRPKQQLTERQGLSGVLAGSMAVASDKALDLILFILLLRDIREEDGKGVFLCPVCNF